MILLTHIAKAISLNSAYIINPQHHAEATPLYPLAVKKYSNLPYCKVGRNQLWSKLYEVYKEINEKDSDLYKVVIIEKKSFWIQQELRNKAAIEIMSKLFQFILFILTVLYPDHSWYLFF